MNKYVIINSGEAIRKKDHSSSAVDFTKCKHNISWLYTWQTIPDLSGSDHLFILIWLQKSLVSSPSHVLNENSHICCGLNLNKINCSKFSELSPVLLQVLHILKSHHFDAYHSFNSVLTKWVKPSPSLEIRPPNSSNNYSNPGETHRLKILFNFVKPSNKSKQQSYI